MQTKELVYQTTDGTRYECVFEWRNNLVYAYAWGPVSESTAPREGGGQHKVPNSETYSNTEEEGRAHLRAVLGGGTFIE